MIEVKGLIKKIKGNTVISGLDFSVSRGEIFGIVGPDGAGKSTLLRLVAGISSPCQGEVLINNTSVADNQFLIKEQLAYMPQRFGLYEDLTVEENIYFFGRLFGLSNSRIRSESRRLYEFSRLGPFKNRLAGKLSGGMKQKLGLACCLVHKPELILLDEPTNGVDPVSRRDFWKILYELLTGGVTIVVSTAYLDEAERCNRVALMHKGAFLTVARPADIKKDMQKKLLEITTDNVWGTEEVIRSSGDYYNIIREGNTIKLFVANVAAAEKKLRRLLQGNSIKINDIKKKVPSLENCFMEIVSVRGEQ